jgi:hypothetical protein
MLRLILSLLLAQLAVANVEKTVFLAPDSDSMPSASPNLDNLCLEPLAPSASTLNKLLPVRFPSKDHPHGRQSWYLIKGLRPGRRYEVRVCWAATVRAIPFQPSEPALIPASNERPSASPPTPSQTRLTTRSSSHCSARTRRSGSRAAANPGLPTATITLARRPCSSSPLTPPPTSTRLTRR